MKKLSVTMLVAFIMLATTFTGHAQLSISVRIGTPPVWAPAPYAHNTRYYYIPEIDSYYDAYNHGYYYNDGPGWAFSASLPGIYANYNIGSLHHVRVNYFGDRPYTYFEPQRVVYVQRYHPVQYRHDDRERGHWDNGNHGGRGNQWHGDNGGGRGNDNRGDRGHDNGGDRGHGDHGDHGHGHGDH